MLIVTFSVSGCYTDLISSLQSLQGLNFAQKRELSITIGVSIVLQNTCHSKSMLASITKSPVIWLYEWQSDQVSQNLVLSDWQI